MTSPARPPPGVVLCRMSDIAPMQARRFVFTEGDDRFNGVLIQTPRGLRAYADWCPHQMMPLQLEDRPLCLEGNILTCAWHKAQFRTTDGGNHGSPLDAGLLVWPVAVDENGVIRTA